MSPNYQKTLSNPTDKKYARGVNDSNLTSILLEKNVPRNDFHSVTAGVLNSRSICNKSSLLSDHVTENKLDLMIITETWLRENDQVIINELTPDGYKFNHVARQGHRGGGIGVLYRKSFNLIMQSNVTYTSFEQMDVLLTAVSNYEMPSHL